MMRTFVLAVLMSAAGFVAGATVLGGLVDESSGPDCRGAALRVANAIEAEYETASAEVSAVQDALTRSGLLGCLAE